MTAFNILRNKYPAQKKKISIKNSFSKYDQIHRKAVGVVKFTDEILNGKQQQLVVSAFQINHSFEHLQRAATILNLCFNLYYEKL